MIRRARVAVAARGTGIGAVALGLVLVLSLSACVVPGRQGRQPGLRRPAPISLDVDNQNFYDADVYALIGGQRIRLGMVTGEQKASFTFPWTPQNVSMEIHLIGGGTYRTDTLAVYPDDRLQLIIMPDLHTRVSVIRPD